MEQTLEEVRSSPLPFANYPKDEAKLRKSIWIGSNCRHEYGLKFIQVTRQNCCAYCRTPIATDYNAWLTMVIDHAVPVSVCKNLKIPPEFCRSLANMVLACAACNGFDNRYKPSFEPRDATFQEFLAFRDRVFIERLERIRERRKKEREDFFEKKVKLLFG
ncbi:MAG: HNH endonuclease signature motif containing protein [Terracidiphilus sp.]|jgi:5-methylcytosine-specific restriction endonuclease McrA